MASGISSGLKWGVLGNATIARVCVIPAIRKSCNGTVHALATRTPHKAEAFCAAQRISRLYDDYSALIHDPAVEAVYVPLPNHLHCEWTIKALNAGKHVLCEKPLARNAREAERMAAASRAADRLLMEAFMYRFHPRSRAVRRLVLDGAIGAARLVRAAFCFRMPDPALQNADNTRLKQDLGGGALLDVGCYAVGVARWLFNAEPVKVQAQADYCPGGADLHLAGTLSFDGGRLATLEASFVSGLQQTYSVVGEQGVIDLPQDAFVPWEKDALYTLREKGAESSRPTVVPGADQYQLMVEHFAQAVRGEVSLDISLAESMANMRVLDALALAARSGKTVAVGPAP